MPAPLNSADVGIPIPRPVKVSVKVSRVHGSLWIPHTTSICVIHSPQREKAVKTNGARARSRALNLGIKSPEAVIDSQDDSQIDGQSRIAANSSGALNLKLDRRRTPMDGGGHLSRGLQNRGGLSLDVRSSSHLFAGVRCRGQ